MTRVYTGAPDFRSVAHTDPDHGKEQRMTNDARDEEITLTDDEMSTDDPSALAGAAPGNPDKVGDAYDPSVILDLDYWAFVPR